MSAPELPSPPFLYGTAWKEDSTAGLVRMALEAGYRGIDTANQRRHYHEAGVGEALRRAFDEGLVTRGDLFLQTKFTHLPGQDHRLPYDPEAAPADQVRQSFASSLEHLGVESVDSLVLHGPLLRHGLHPADVEAWQAMEEVAETGGARVLGASNVSRPQLEELAGLARVRPSFVQNRCFARTGWDADVRAWCRENQVVYQGFSLLTANPEIVGSPEVGDMAQARGVTPAQVVFAFARAVGMLPLTGTTCPDHARQDLESLDLELGDEDVATIERLAI